MTTNESPRRGRGNRAGLDRDQIVAAARGIEPAALTMQRVADALGVDRKALNHHVTDRESLLELLALDAFRRRFERAEADLGATWQDACRGYAAALIESIIDTGEWIGYLRFASPGDLAIIAPAETVAERLRGAGFGTIATSRGMHLLTSICQGFARDAIRAGWSSDDPQVARLRLALAQTTAGYPVLRELVEARIDNHGADQLRFDLDAFIAAMEHVLRSE